jgi:hypothetical protein
MGDGVERPKLPLFKRFESSGYCFTISHAFQAQLKKVDEKVPKTLLPLTRHRRTKYLREERERAPEAGYSVNIVSIIRSSQSGLASSPDKEPWLLRMAKEMSIGSPGSQGWETLRGVVE